MENYVTIPEAMAMLHYSSRESLNNFLKKHKIRKSKPSGRVYINRLDIERAVDRVAVPMNI